VFDILLRRRCAKQLYAQNTTSVAPPASSTNPTTIPTPFAEIDSVTKIAAAVITGLATIFGLPLILLNYKKTRAEITKINLEAAALQEKLTTEGEPKGIPSDTGTKIKMDQSPNTRVEITADPRLLAPLLLMLDFIFAWIVIVLVGDFLDILDFAGVRQIILPIFAVVLLLPIAREIIRTRAGLRPPQSQEEIGIATKQARIAVYGGYVMAAVSAILIGILLLVAVDEPVAHIFAWILLGIGAILVVVSPILKRRADHYLYNLIKPAN
jgi:hypothetical protein